MITWTQFIQIASMLNVIMIYAFLFLFSFHSFFLVFVFSLSQYYTIHYSKILSMILTEFYIQVYQIYQFIYWLDLKLLHINPIACKQTFLSNVISDIVFNICCSFTFLCLHFRCLLVVYTFALFYQYYSSTTRFMSSLNNFSFKFMVSLSFNVRKQIFNQRKNLPFCNAHFL